MAEPMHDAQHGRELRLLASVTAADPAFLGDQARDLFDIRAEARAAAPA
jgi:hypothetical protein